MNVLVILCDQLRPFELGCYGHKTVKTPNIDKLADQGVRFEYACTTNPLCTPARSTLLSGQFGRTCTGMLECSFEPEPQRVGFSNATLPEILQEQGYETSLIGKWHIAPEPKYLGFDKAVYPKVNHLNVNQDYYDYDRNHFIAEGFAPEFNLKQFDDFLSKPCEKPFFTYYNISLPHMPYFDVPDEFRYKYSREDVEIRPNAYIDGRLCSNDYWFHVYVHDYLYYMKLKDNLTLPKNFDLVDLTAQYYGLVSCVDWEVGRIIEMLEQKGIREETLVIFTSDHGDSLGSHDCYNKHTFWDEAVRVPMIMSLPSKIKKGVRKNTVASLVDIAPTVLSMLGNEIPEYMQGKDLTSAICEENENLPNNYAVFENANGEIAIRTPSHLYSLLTSCQEGTPNRKIENDRYMYFDTENDPYQLCNLAKSEEPDDESEALRDILLEWDKKTPWLAGSLGGSHGLGLKKKKWF